MVPPIRLWDAGVPNRAALAIMTRNSRMPESLAADLDAECSACLMGARRLGELFDRYGVEAVESCFDAILDRTTTTYRREILAKIPVGTWTWEDYAEHDGVDEPRLHTQRITLTRTPADDPDGERLILDFDGTGPQAKGPINHCGDYSDGVFLKKWLAPILRNLADIARADGRARRQRGRRAAHRDAVPRPGHAAHAGLPGADQRPHVRDPAAARRARRRASPRRSTAGCPPTRRRSATPASTARTATAGRTSCARCSAVAPAAATTPTARTPSTSCPTRATCRASSPSRASRSSSSRSGWRWTPAGRGEFRGGLGYEKHIRMLKDAHFMSIADRSILACWGVRGGRAGQPFQVTIDPGGPHEREVDALADAEPVRAGEVIRIRTTGGGGWGDPLDRDPALVVRDVVWRKVSPRGGAGRLRRGADRLAGRRRPGLRRRGDGSAERAGRPAGHEPFFDRGPGYARSPAAAALPSAPPRSTGSSRMRVLLALGRQRHDQRRRPGPARGPDRRGRDRDGVRRRPGRRRRRRRGHPRQRPQVGNLLVKNELAAAVVPPVPLDWCGAQTQATLGFVLMDALDAVAGRARRRPAQRRAWSPAPSSTPTTPASRTPDQADRAVPARRGGAALIEHGETWEDRGEKGWRRVVASPEPLEILDAPAVQALVEAGFVVVANGGGGIPVVRDARRRAARRRGRHRQGPRRRPAGPVGRRRRARHRHRRARTPCSASARPRPTPVGRVTVAEMRALRRRGPLRQRLDGPQGRRRLPLRRAGRRPRRDHRPGPHRRGGDRSADRQRRHRRRTELKHPPERNSHAQMPSRSARSRSTPSPTPASSPSSSTTA